MNKPTELAKEIQMILKFEFRIDSLIKGSCGYGIPSEVSDIDIQLKLDNKDTFVKLKQYFHAQEVDPVKIIDNDGNLFTSYMLVLKKNGVDISLLYDDNPNIYKLVEDTLKTITGLPLEQRYILRLIGGSYKYLGKDAYKTLLEIFNKIEPVLDHALIKKIKNGEMIEQDKAQTIRKMAQALFVNETNCQYPRKFLI